MLEDRENETAQQGALVLRNVESAISSLETLPISEVSSTEENDDLTIEEVQQEVQQELQQDIAQCKDQLQAFEETLSESLSKLHEERTGVNIKKVRLSDDGKALIGVFNVEGGAEEIRKIKVDVEDVEVKHRAQGAFGVVNGMDVNAFFK